MGFEGARNQVVFCVIRWSPSGSVFDSDFPVSIGENEVEQVLIRSADVHDVLAAGGSNGVFEHLFGFVIQTLERKCEIALADIFPFYADYAGGQAEEIGGAFATAF